MKRKASMGTGMGKWMGFAVALGRTRRGCMEHHVA